MKLRKGKWKYKLPTDTHEIIRALLVMKDVNFLLQYVRPEELIIMRKESKKKNNGDVLQGTVSYISMAMDEGVPYLLVSPEPYKAMELKLMATKVFEI